MEWLPSFFLGAAVTIAALTLLPLFAALSWLRWIRRKQTSKERRPPVLGTVLHQLLNNHRLYDYHVELSNKHRTFRMLAPDCSYVYTVEPANVEHILRTNFSNYGRGDRLHDLMEDLFGDGIFNIDGDKWRHQRKIASLEFSAKTLRQYSTGVFAASAAKLAGIVGETATSNQMLEIRDLIMRSTLDTIFEIGFGVELDTLSGGNAEGLAFMEALDGASCQLHNRVLDVTWKLKRLFNVGAEARMKEWIRRIDGFLYRCIDAKIEQMASQRAEFVSSAEKSDILSRFLLERERDPSGMDSKYLRDIILNFVIAGKDTTAGTLSWFLYMMCKHQQAQETIAGEVIEAIGSSDHTMSYHEFVERISEEAMARMVYLQAALTETLRLYPAVPLDPKHCYADDVLPDGFEVKKGDMVAYQPYPMGRMEFLWGRDVREFKPERWLNSDGVFVQESPFKFSAFQAGPRICLGKDFAYRQMKIVAATLLYFYRFEMWDEEAVVHYRPMITLQMDSGLFLRVQHRMR